MVVGVLERHTGSVCEFTLTRIYKEFVLEWGSSFQFGKSFLL